MKNNSEVYKILYIADPHGANMVYKKAVGLACVLRVNALIIGGDLTGKTLNIIRNVGNKKYILDYLGENITVNQDELSIYLKNFADIGGYPIILSENEHREYLENEEVLSRCIIEKMEIRLREWMFDGERKLVKNNISLLMACGNSDPYEIDKVLSESSFVLNPEASPVMLNDLYEVVSESSTNITPFSCNRQYDEDIIESNIEDKVKKINDMGRAIFMFHAPPINSTLDEAPELDADKRPIAKGGVIITKPVGSTSVRKAIEKYKPLLSLHGHIHDCPGTTKIGRTLCINPGSVYVRGVVQCYMIVLDRDSVVECYSINK